MTIALSKTAIDKFLSCPRCFFLKYRHKLDQPEMISSKLWKGCERVTIAHYEKHRQAKTTPPNLIGQVPEGAIPYQGDRIDLKSLRYWGKGLRFEVDGVLVSTALDDMLQWESAGGRRYAVVDYKSKSKATDEKATAQLYQTQADIFDLAANTNEYPTDGFVYFDYHFPIEIERGEQPGNTFQRWGSQVIALNVDHARIKKIILDAAACLDSEIPDSGEKCPVCSYVSERKALMESIDASAKPE